jgi:hypothetical protein
MFNRRTRRVQFGARLPHILDTLEWTVLLTGYRHCARQANDVEGPRTRPVLWRLPEGGGSGSEADPTSCEWSGRRDLNPRSPGPEPGAIPCFATSRHDAATRRGARSWLALRSRTECSRDVVRAIAASPRSFGNCGGNYCAGSNRGSATAIICSSGDLQPEGPA